MSAETAAPFEEVQTPWWLILVEGIVLLIAGILFLVYPGISSVVAVRILGLYWLFAGIFKIIGIFLDRNRWGWKLIIGVIGILAGLLVLQAPVGITLIVGNTLIIVLGLMGLMMGVVTIIQAIQGAGWGTGILGVLSVILGFVLLANSMKLTFSLPMALGLLAIAGGLVTLYMAFQVRAEEKVTKYVPVKPAEPEAPAIEESEPVVDTSSSVSDEPSSVSDEPSSDSDEPSSAAATAAAVEVATSAKAAAEPVEEDESAAELAESEEEPPPEAASLHGSLTNIEGIGSKYAESLNAAGLHSPGDLLEKGSTPKGRAEIAEQTGISPKLILSWLNYADLFRVNGIGSQYAELLEAAGVDTVPELAQRNPKNLHASMEKVNTERKHVRKMPTEAQVESWVNQAKELPRKIQY